jgi:hypothetical protein
MTTQNPNSVQPASQAGTNQAAKANGGTTLSLDFDPNLVFDITPNPLALGETNMVLHAGASLLASVQLKNFLNQSYGPANILNAAIDIVAKRCSISTMGTQLEILGQNIDLSQFGVPIFDTLSPNSDPNGELYAASKACQDAIDEYQVVAGRVKKAFRDAQQLLWQYHNVGKLLTGNLCSMIAAANLDTTDFPGGATCYSNESIESIINRFTYYYQQPGLGQVSQLRSANSLLSSASAKITQQITSTLNQYALGDDGGIKLQFLNESHQETQTIVDVQFAIGPVPCLLQVDLSTNYGVTGNFALELGFPSILDVSPPTPPQPPPPPTSIAHVSANVMPYASAALSAFVGAGFDLGPFSASLGLEGVVYLAQAQAPLFAGAGVGMQVLNDLRPIPNDAKPPVSIGENALQFGVPKAFKFIANYDYGMRLDVTKVLAGEIDARLRISFCFFSRTWRKRVVKFNGFEFHYDLISGGNSLDVTVGARNPGDSHTVAAPTTGSPDAGTTVASGATTMGLSETEVPLMQLAYLPMPESGSTGGGGGATPDGGVAAQEFGSPPESVG